MKKNILFLIILVMSTINMTFAKNKITCKLEADKGKRHSNLTTTLREPISFDECRSKGEELFNSIAGVDFLVKRPAKHLVTHHTWKVQYTRIKMSYYADDGVKYVIKLSRSKVNRTDIEEESYYVANGWKCFLFGKCEPL